MIRRPPKSPLFPYTPLFRSDTITIGACAASRSSTAPRINVCVPPPDAPVHASRDLSARSEEHTSELQSQSNLVCRLLLEKKKKHTQLVIVTTKRKWLRTVCT